jgi:hypothetical protein
MNVNLDVLSNISVWSIMIVLRRHCLSIRTRCELHWPSNEVLTLERTVDLRNPRREYSGVPAENCAGRQTFVGEERSESLDDNELSLFPTIGPGFH